jgi:hypothetical protein
MKKAHEVALATAPVAVSGVALLVVSGGNPAAFAVEGALLAAGDDDGEELFADAPIHDIIGSTMPKHDNDVSRLDLNF